MARTRKSFRLNGKPFNPTNKKRKSPESTESVKSTKKKFTCASISETTSRPSDDSVDERRDINLDNSGNNLNERQANDEEGSNEKGNLKDDNMYGSTSDDSSIDSVRGSEESDVIILKKTVKKKNVVGGERRGWFRGEKCDVADVVIDIDEEYKELDEETRQNLKQSVEKSERSYFETNFVRVTKSFPVQFFGLFLPMDMVDDETSVNHRDIDKERCQGIAVSFTENIKSMSVKVLVTETSKVTDGCEERIKLDYFYGNKNDTVYNKSPSNDVESDFNSFLSTISNWSEKYNLMAGDDVEKFVKDEMDLSTDDDAINYMYRHARNACSKKTNICFKIIDGQHRAYTLQQILLSKMTTNDISWFLSSSSFQCEFFLAKSMDMELDDDALTRFKHFSHRLTTEIGMAKNAGYGFMISKVCEACRISKVSLGMTSFFKKGLRLKSSGMKTVEGFMDYRSKVGSVLFDIVKDHYTDPTCGYMKFNDKRNHAGIQAEQLIERKKTFICDLVPRTLTCGYAQRHLYLSDNFAPMIYETVYKNAFGQTTSADWFFKNEIAVLIACCCRGTTSIKTATNMSNVNRIHADKMYVRLYEYISFCVYTCSRDLKKYLKKNKIEEVMNINKMIYLVEVMLQDSLLGAINIFFSQRRKVNFETLKFQQKFCQFIAKCPNMPFNEIGDKDLFKDKTRYGFPYELSPYKFLENISDKKVGSRVIPSKLPSTPLEAFLHCYAYYSTHLVKEFFENTGDLHSKFFHLFKCQHSTVENTLLEIPYMDRVKGDFSSVDEEKVTSCFEFVDHITIGDERFAFNPKTLAENVLRVNVETPTTLNEDEDLPPQFAIHNFSKKKADENTVATAAEAGSNASNMVASIGDKPTDTQMCGNSDFVDVQNDVTEDGEVTSSDKNVLDSATDKSSDLVEATPPAVGNNSEKGVDSSAEKDKVVDDSKETQATEQSQALSDSEDGIETANESTPGETSANIEGSNPEAVVVPVTEVAKEGSSEAVVGSETKEDKGTDKSQEHIEEILDQDTTEEIWEESGSEEEAHGSDPFFVENVFAANENDVPNIEHQNFMIRMTGNYIKEATAISDLQSLAHFIWKEKKNSK